VVTDPDPDGIPSPLRTAKVAWAAVSDDATHHLVVQDDVSPARDMAHSVPHLITARPDHGIALYVNWNSPQNSYLMRRAALAESPWAYLSAHEYTPLLGFLLPATKALGLAAHLATLPDRLRDDDEAVTPFCRAQGIPVVATVPNLLEHRGDRSLAGNDSHGSRHSVIRASAFRANRQYWLQADKVTRALKSHTQSHAPRPYAVELVASTCRIRFVRSDTREVIEHAFGWHWRDWCQLTGIRAVEIISSWRDALGDLKLPGWSQAAVHSQPALELWAACFLLGVDTAYALHNDGLPHAFVAEQATQTQRCAVETWVSSGFLPEHSAELDCTTREALIRLGLKGIAAGIHGHHVGIPTLREQPSQPTAVS
jgi:hypothetical protein